MGRIVHFEISADDPDRAAAFYRKALGWEISDFGGPERYLLVTTGPEGEAGINGAITTRAGHRQAVVNTVDVADWHAAARAVVEAGGTVLTGMTEIPGIGYFAYCTDTEGNVFGILEASSTAGREAAMSAAAEAGARSD